MDVDLARYPGLARLCSVVSRWRGGGDRDVVTVCRYDSIEWRPLESAAQDAEPDDAAPDRCWRCDALAGIEPLGLCAPCHADLTAAPQ